MADVVKFKTPDEQRPLAVVGRSYEVVRRFTVVSGDCPQNDNIIVFDVPIGHQVVDCMLRQSATLGASATAQLRIATTAITAATTAGSASAVFRNSTVPVFDSAAEQSLNILIAGAAITATAVIEVWVRLVDMRVAG